MNIGVEFLGSGSSKTAYLGIVVGRVPGKATFGGVAGEDGTYSGALLGYGSPGVTAIVNNVTTLKNKRISGTFTGNVQNVATVLAGKATARFTC